MSGIGQHGGRRILLVDDNVDAAMTTAELLRLLGNEVAVVHDGIAAVDATCSMQPEIVLLDIGLPCIDGYEVAKRIRANADISQPRLIALTGWGQEKDKFASRDAGFDDHLVKPLDLERLLETINKQMLST
ncbi:response regulator receiver domain-containing protein [Paucimonas lemoignei]|uniref:Response regulator receiver domain-containing protein n=1 Tax=Paucimonas lemoignei TaxID=29443 RepID=A0A4R3I167_PAULE|nr:response regulator [Paucimonas lemoignei]TCS39308.1 response regulator receiver domain-containing protein [Paucimonas lemoignei]